MGLRINQDIAAIHAYRTLSVTDGRAASTGSSDAIATVSTRRANLGAYQNRLEHTIAELRVAVENLSASESRTRDTLRALLMTRADERRSA